MKSALLPTIVLHFCTSAGQIQPERGGYLNLQPTLSRDKRHHCLDDNASRNIGADDIISALEKRNLVKSLPPPFRYIYIILYTIYYILYTIYWYNVQLHNRSGVDDRPVLRCSSLPFPYLVERRLCLSFPYDEGGVELSLSLSVRHLLRQLLPRRRRQDPGTQPKHRAPKEHTTAQELANEVRGLPGIRRRVL